MALHRQPPRVGRRTVAVTAVDRGPPRPAAPTGTPAAGRLRSPQLAAHHRAERRPGAGAVGQDFPTRRSPPTPGRGRRPAGSSSEGVRGRGADRLRRTAVRASRQRSGSRPDHHSPHAVDRGLREVPERGMARVSTKTARSSVGAWNGSPSLRLLPRRCRSIHEVWPPDPGGASLRRLRHRGQAHSPRCPRRSPPCPGRRPPPSTSRTRRSSPPCVIEGRATRASSSPVGARQLVSERYGGDLVMPAPTPLVDGLTRPNGCSEGVAFLDYASAQEQDAVGQGASAVPEGHRSSPRPVPRVRPRRPPAESRENRLTPGQSAQ
ncbi:hypothetical protein SCALM49S_06740 [Streptomyces californicus]